MNMSITGPVIANLFDRDDPEADNLVTSDVFVKILADYVNQQSTYGNDCLTITIRDLKFLSTKYASYGNPMEEQRYVDYMKFIEDYEEIESEGIGAGNSALMFGNKVLKRDVALRNRDAWKPKTLEELPNESKDIYLKMSAKLKHKGIEDDFCQGLVVADVLRDGYISKMMIRDVIVKNDMPKISMKQVDLLTQVLSMDGDGHNNYLEMIALLLGENTMMRVRDDNQITLAGIKGEVRGSIIKKIDIENLFLSSRLQN